MIQLNLLPDIKQQYLKSKRSRQLVGFVSMITVGASLAILAFLFVTTNLLQSKSISDLDKDIDASLVDLSTREDVAKILTVQNQLNVITQLHDNKPDVEKLFAYLPSAVPEGVTITDLQFDFISSTFSIDGETQRLDLFNKFLDSLKFTEITPVSPDEPVILSGKAFSNITFSTSLDETKATYSIEGSFVPELFLESERTVQLSVPKITTTRSEIERPASSLFSESTAEPAGGGN